MCVVSVGWQAPVSFRPILQGFDGEHDADLSRSLRQHARSAGAYEVEPAAGQDAFLEWRDDHLDSVSASDFGHALAGFDTDDGPTGISEQRCHPSGAATDIDRSARTVS